MHVQLHAKEPLIRPRHKYVLRHRSDLISQMRHKAQFTVSLSVSASLWCGAGRAAAAAGQSGLMALYDSLFGLMDCQAAQILVTSNDFADADFRKNLSATTEDLLSMNVVPVFNENDAISSRTAAEVVRPRLSCDSFVGL